MSERKHLFDSRIIRVVFIGLAVMTVITASAHILIWWLSAQAVALARENITPPDLLTQVATSLASSVGIAAFATVLTALIARYGLREATRNLSSPRNQIGGQQ